MALAPPHYDEVLEQVLEDARAEALQEVLEQQHNELEIELD